ncbi:MAG: ThuA domain-containing protein [Verrucomicrobia bacterium]|nr:ThuA domain-containing protein [Verrucomicrobiota bacterium]
MKLPLPRLLVALSLGAFPLFAASAPKPLRILLVTGGCCHDYPAQKDLLKKGLEARANVVVEHMHTPDKSTRPPLDCLTNPNYAAGFDLVIHDECAADVKDADLLANVLKPHRDGLPAVALHCAMHSYRVSPDFRTALTPGSAGAGWFDFLGLQSSGHGPQEPIAITFAEPRHPITKGLADWTTIKEELYNNVQPPTAFPAHRSLATGRQTTTNKKSGQTSESKSVVVWTNEFGPKKARVFSTTIGHNNATVDDARYLDLVARGLLWAAGKLDDSGKPLAGYGPGGK